MFDIDLSHPFIIGVMAGTFCLNIWSGRILNILGNLLVGAAVVDITLLFYLPYIESASFGTSAMAGMGLVTILMSVVRRMWEREYERHGPTTRPDVSVWSNEYDLDSESMTAEVRNRMVLAAIRRIPTIKELESCEQVLAHLEALQGRLNGNALALTVCADSSPKELLAAMKSAASTRASELGRAAPPATSVWAHLGQTD